MIKKSCHGQAISKALRGVWMVVVINCSVFTQTVAELTSESDVLPVLLYCTLYPLSTLPTVRLHKALTTHNDPEAVVGTHLVCCFVATSWW